MIPARGCWSGPHWKWRAFASDCVEAICRASRGLRGARCGHAGDERLRRVQRAAQIAGGPSCADIDANQPRRHGVGQPRLQRGGHGLHLQRHQPHVARPARQIPGAIQTDSGSAARERGARALSRLLRPAHRASQPATLAAGIGTRARMGRAAPARSRRLDARRRQLLPDQRHAGAGGGRRVVEGSRASLAKLLARLSAHAGSSG